MALTTAKSRVFCEPDGLWRRRAILCHPNILSGMTRGWRVVMKRSMVAFLTQLLLAIRSWFTRRARLEAENLLLRQSIFSSAVQRAG